MSTPFDNFVNNGSQVLDLITLHEEKNSGKKTHHTYEILTKSCVVLMVACWEAFIEDIAEKSVEFLVENSESPNDLPKSLLKHIALELKNEKNELKIWELAGDGWKKITKDHYKVMLRKHLGPFNTPRAGNIDDLYKKVLGLENLSSNWTWKGMTNKSAKAKLSDMITLRGSIAHRVQTSKKVSRKIADKNALHLIYLAIKTSNKVRTYLYKETGAYIWGQVSSDSIK